MSIGFRAVQLIALGVYGVAVLAFLALRRRAGRPADPEPITALTPGFARRAELSDSPP
jgi:hypothetical protein